MYCFEIRTGFFMKVASLIIWISETFFTKQHLRVLYFLNVINGLPGYYMYVYSDVMSN